MSEADILAMTYTDTCTVYRAYKERLPSGETAFQKGLNGRRIYESIPCALSSPSGGKLQQSPSTATAAAGWLLFVRPEIEIEPNDTVEILTLGRIFYMAAGLAQRYVSHNCVPLRLRKEMV